MKELIEYIVKSLVVDEGSVKVSLAEEGEETVVHVFVASDDMGRVIGKGGKIASAIRAIAKAAGGHEHKKVYVKFGE